MSSAESNKIIRRKKGLESLDDLINQFANQNETPNVSDDQSKSQETLEITTEVKEKMETLMDQYIAQKEQLKKCKALKKKITNESNQTLKELETIMKLFGVNETIKGSNKFSLNKTEKKKTLPKEKFKEVISNVVKDPTKVQEIFDTAGQLTEKVTIEQIKYSSNADKK